MLRTVAALLLALLAVSLGSPSVQAQDHAEAALLASAGLREAITAEGLLRHLEAFQAIAERHGGNRSAGSPGYDASVDYVRQQLEAAGYRVTVQRFEVEAFAERSPTLLERREPDPRTFAAGVDLAIMTFSGSGEVTARVTAVDLTLPPGPANSSTSGCEAADFDGFPPGDVALLQRGRCTFAVKASNAAAAGARAVVIFNEGQPGRRELLLGTLGRTGAEIPVLGASFATGEDLARSGGTLYLRSDVVSGPRPTSNVIAESVAGGAGRVVMAGGHLDSVPAGPGIQDNGSGSAALLEVALQLAETVGVNGGEKVLANRIRFAWWGAEELGLLGSEHYLGTLSDRERDALLAYLNLDMVGSPNFGRFVYDGDGSDRRPAVPANDGAAAIERLLLDVFEAEGLAVLPIAVFDRSDHVPFAEAGVPVGGLYTGAEEHKSAAEAERFGGEPGRPFDACYHLPCDTLDNVDLTVLEQMADAAAHALLTLVAKPVPTAR